MLNCLGEDSIFNDEGSSLSIGLIPSSSGDLIITSTGGSGLRLTKSPFGDLGIGCDWSSFGPFGGLCDLNFWADRAGTCFLMSPLLVLMGFKVNGFTFSLEEVDLEDGSSAFPRSFLVRAGGVIKSKLSIFRKSASLLDFATSLVGVWALFDRELLEVALGSSFEECKGCASVSFGFF